MHSTLTSYGFAVGDIVTYASDEDSTGGVIFQIVENCDPVVPAGRKPRGRGNYSYDLVDEQGRKIEPMRINGYIRLKPLYAFFPTELGKKPRGKGTTVLLYHSILKEGDRVKKVDLVTLGTRYAELGTLIRDLALAGGMVIPESWKGESSQ